MATTKVGIGPMKAAQILKAGADFQIVEREIPEPGVGHVRIKVQACGVCHSDALTKEGLWPGIQYPRVPGHEVVGIIADVDVVIVREGKNLKGRLLGAFLGIVGKGQLEKVFARSLKAIEARNYEISAAAKA